MIEIKEVFLADVDAMKANTEAQYLVEKLNLMLGMRFLQRYDQKAIVFESVFYIECMKKVIVNCPIPEIKQALQGLVQEMLDSTK